jgi:hypothetical protein
MKLKLLRNGLLGYLFILIVIIIKDCTSKDYSFLDVYTIRKSSKVMPQRLYFKGLFIS